MVKGVGTSPHLLPRPLHPPQQGLFLIENAINLVFGT